MPKVIEKYRVNADGIPVEIAIVDREDEFVTMYELTPIKLQKPTEVVLEHIKERIIEDVNLKASEMLDIRAAESMKKKFLAKANELVEKEVVNITDEMRNVLVGKLAHDLIGLGDIELLLADENLEEIVVNSSTEPLWVYHKRYGWLKTNFFLKSEEQIQNYASIIGRRVGKQITNLNPILDAHLVTGDRANATLFPIATKGNAITIRKFAKTPWTAANLIYPMRTLNYEVAALLWLCVQYEMNIIFAGGTASGKTSLLNAALVFVPPNQRIVSIEETRELYLPAFLHWTPMVTRSPNPEGKGEVTMLDLMVNSLRMRPDRIVVGEIRRQHEAEVLFEAMHTGHAVYSTIHADNAEQMINRMTTPPINLPESMLGAVHLVFVQYRQRRTGIRRTLEVAELLPGEKEVKLNRVWKWNAKKDEVEKVGNYVRLLAELELYTGMSEKEIEEDLKEKEEILAYMVKNRIYDIDDVGRIVATYYRNRDAVMDVVQKKKSPELLLRREG
ncbi:MAG: type II/IV secretion system ATPase subunit [Candidatus Micrarchaeia archaeon]